MSLLVLGINHRTAPVALREKVVFTDHDLPAALAQLRQLPSVREALIVSTCNRTELYCHADDSLDPHRQQHSLATWLHDWHDLQHADLAHCLYQHRDADAVRHVFAVACGLDSMVLGEAQILGQLKEAYRIAQSEGNTGLYLNRLFQAAFAAAKHVRTETRIGANAVSVASAAVSMARTVFDDLSTRTVLLVGAGDTIHLAAKHLVGQGARRMIIANRTLAHAQHLASEFNGYAIELTQLDSHLHEADIVVSSTASPHVVITLATVQAALKQRKRRPIFMVDLAVPRDIDPEVGQLSDIYLFTVDHLQNLVTQNKAARADAAQDAQALLDDDVHQFIQQLRTLDAVPSIRQLRDDAEALRAHTLQQAQRLLKSGRPADEVLSFLADTLTHRLMHTPSQRLREAGEQGDTELIRAAQKLFARDKPE